MNADALLIASEGDNGWLSSTAVRGMEKLLVKTDHNYRVKAIVYPYASHLLGTYPPESWKKAFSGGNTIDTIRKDDQWTYI